jgi:hypothetical protein
MEWVLVAVLLLVVAGGAAYLVLGRRRAAATALADARAEAQRWYERLGGQLTNLPGGADQPPAVRQALADASERYNAAGSALASASSNRQFELARETALEGLQYIRAARQALGFDPGPDLPPPASGEITKDRMVDVQGHRYAAGPGPGPQTPYFHPGGFVAGRPVPRGWYSEPWWRTALVAGAWGLGSVLIFDALFSPAWGDPGYALGDAGMGDGDLGDGGYEVTGDELAGDFGDAGGDFGGGDFGDAGGDFGGGDF